MEVEKLFQPLNQSLDTPKRGLLAQILPVRKEHGQTQQTPWDIGAGMMHSTYVTRNEEGRHFGTATRERRLRKEVQQPDGMLAGKRRETGRQVSPY